MKKIISRQITKAGCVIEANPQPQTVASAVTTTSPLQTAISGSLGCVSGALQAQQAQPGLFAQPAQPAQPKPKPKK